MHRVIQDKDTSEYYREGSRRFVFTDSLILARKFEYEDDAIEYWELLTQRTNRRLQLVCIR